jgi:hypothetical protein
MEQKITISGLTQHQVELLDAMWQISELEDVEQWQQTLPEQDQHQVDLLLRLVVLAATDHILVEDTSEAQAYLQKFRL